MNVNLQDLVNAMPMFVWIKDCEGRYTYVNPEFCKLVGRSAEEILRMTSYALWDEDTALRISRDDARVISTRSMLFKQNLFQINGTPTWIEYRLFPIHDDHEKVVAIAGAGADITLRKETEGQLTAALDTALESRHLASLGIMAAGIAHEINQPLQAIKLSADSVGYWFEKKNKFDPITIMKAMGLISRNADRIGRIIQRMRKFVKSRQAVKSISAVDLNQAVKDGIEMLETQLRAHGVILILELGAEISKVTGEDTQMEEIIINLVTNAVQSLDQAEAVDKRIRIRTFEQEETVCLTVSDTGTGFSEESRVNLFHPFFTTKTDGLGLGLSIVHSIITGFSGKIELLPPTDGYATELAVTLLKWQD